MIRIRGDEEVGYSATVVCADCDGCMVFRPSDHGLWVGSPRQVRIYMTDHAGWVWDGYTDTFHCPVHFR